MSKHYNIYYLFLEDKRQHPMPKKQRIKILKHLQKLFKKEKPP